MQDAGCRECKRVSEIEKGKKKEERRVKLE
jgi:hypothetical protein